MDRVTSRDGTTIAFDRVGDGPPVILVCGAMCDRALMRPTAEGLARRFTVFNYDRWGRGDSGGTTRRRSSARSKTSAPSSPRSCCTPPLTPCPTGGTVSWRAKSTSYPRGARAGAGRVLRRLRRRAGGRQKVDPGGNEERLCRASSPYLRKVYGQVSSSYPCSLEECVTAIQGCSRPAGLPDRPRKRGSRSRGTEPGRTLPP